MAISHIGHGARVTAGTTTATPAFPASSVVAGRLAIAHRAIKPNTATATAEAGWTQIQNVTGGTGTTGVDVGQTRLSVDTKVLVGGEANPTFDQASSPNSVTGAIGVYDPGGGTWDVASTLGNDATHGTGVSYTGAAALALQPGDVLLCIAASDTDSATAYTSPAFTAAGVTFSAPVVRLARGGATTGNDVGSFIYETTVSAGTATVAPAFTASGGPSSCGPCAFVRLRAITAATIEGTGVGASVSTGAGTAERVVVAAGSGPSVSAGAGTAGRVVAATAASSSVSAGSATGVVPAIVDATAVSASISSGSAAGSPVRVGSGAGTSITSGAGQALRVVSGTASSLSVSSGAGSGVRLVAATAAGSSPTTGSGVGVREVRGAGSGASVTAGSAAGARIVAATGQSGSVSSGHAAAVSVVTGAGAGASSSSGAAVGVRVVAGWAASLSLSAGAGVGGAAPPAPPVGRMVTMVVPRRTRRVEVSSLSRTGKSTPRGATIVRMIDHDPYASLDYNWDWSGWLEPGDSIAEHEVTLSSPAMDLVSTSHTDTGVKAWLSGGTPGSIARVSVTITTVAGRKDRRTSVLRVAEQ